METLADPPYNVLRVRSWEGGGDSRLDRCSHQSHSWELLPHWPKRPYFCLLCSCITWHYHHTKMSSKDHISWNPDQVFHRSLETVEGASTKIKDHHAISVFNTCAPSSLSVCKHTVVPPSHSTKLTSEPFQPISIHAGKPDFYSRPRQQQNLRHK